MNLCVYTCFVYLQPFCVTLDFKLFIDSIHILFLLYLLLWLWDFIIKNLQDFIKIYRALIKDIFLYVMWVYHDMLQFQVHVGNWAPPQKMKFSASDLKYLRTYVIDRWNFLHQLVYSVAYLCNPHLHATPNWQCSELLKSDLRTVVHTFVGDKGSKALLQLHDYRLKCGDFSDSLLWTEEATKGSALGWWDLWGGGVPELQDVLKRVFPITCVTSGAERNSSIFGFLHSKNRNRLYNDKVTKLVFVYQHLRALCRLRRTGYCEPTVEFSDEEGEEQ